jgi:hypothetical protein
MIATQKDSHVMGRVLSLLNKYRTLLVAATAAVLLYRLAGVGKYPGPGILIFAGAKHD